MGKIIDGKAIAAGLYDEMRQEVEQMGETYGRRPGLPVIIVGEDPASQVYVRNKEVNAIKVGLVSEVIRMPEQTTQEELLAVIDRLNADATVDGILVQLPVPKHIDKDAVIAAVAPDKDVDGFTPINIGRMVLGEDSYVPATPMGICTLLKRYNVETAGKHCVVLGRSNIVGTPIANLLSRKGFDCTVTICHSKTKNLAEITRQADILIAAIGKPEFVTADMVKEGAVLVDVGIHRIPDETKKSGYRIIGDAKHSEVDAKCSWVTPVPGGVGPLTIVSLMENTLKAYNRHQKQ